MDFLRYFGKDITLLILSNINTIHDILSVLGVCKDWNKLVIEKKIANLVSDKSDLFRRALLNYHWNTIEHYVHDKNFMVNPKINDEGEKSRTGLQYIIDVMCTTEKTDEIIQWRNVARYIVDHYLDHSIRHIFYIAFTVIELEEKEKVTMEWINNIMEKHVAFGFPSEGGAFVHPSKPSGYIKHFIEYGILRSRNMTLIRSTFRVDDPPLEEFLRIVRYLGSERDLDVLKYFILECTWPIPNFKTYIADMLHSPNALKILAQCPDDRIIYPIGLGDMEEIKVKQHAPELIAWLKRNNSRLGLGFVFRKK